MSTVTYVTPVAGTTAPTTTEAFRVKSLVATVAMVAADTTAVITHNWGLTAAEAADLQPWIRYYFTASGTIAPIITFALTDTNSITITKLSVADQSGTLVVILERPFSKQL